MDVVKPPADDNRSQSVQCPRVDTLSERIRWILKHRDFDERSLGVAAGLSESFVSVYFQRAKKDPDADMKARGLAAIASAAHVPLRWLVTGESDPEGADLAGVSDSGQPRYENLPGWSLAEAKFRAATPGIPEWAYKDARATQAYAPPGPVTPDFVGQVVMHAYNVVPVEERARRALAAMDTQAKRINTRAENRAKRDAPAAAPFRLEPPKKPAKKKGRKKPRPETKES